MSNRGETTRVVIIDANKLRRAGFASLLAEWAKSNQTDIIATSRIAKLDQSEGSPIIRMIVFSIGEEPIDHQEFRERLKFLRALVPETRLAILSDRSDSETMIAALSAGAHGFIPTSMDPSLAMEALSFIIRGGSFFPPDAALLSPAQFEQASAKPADVGPPGGSAVNGVESKVCSPDEAVHIGPTASTLPVRRLTRRQQQVMELLCQGNPNKAIARALSMTEATVKVHVRQIMRKFGVTNRTQAAIRCMAEMQLSEQIAGTVSANTRSR